jgi:hypothetical protein
VCQPGMLLTCTLLPGRLLFYGPSCGFWMGLGGVGHRTPNNTVLISTCGGLLGRASQENCATARLHLYVSARHDSSLGALA